MWGHKSGPRSPLTTFMKNGPVAAKGKAETNAKGRGKGKVEGKGRTVPLKGCCLERQFHRTTSCCY